MPKRRKPRLTRWLRASLRCVVALILLFSLPSRPALAGCFNETSGRLAPSDDATAETQESDGCCPSRREDSPAEGKAAGWNVPDREQAPHSEPGCPCQNTCPSGCRVACGLAAIVTTQALGLALMKQTPDLVVERVADPPSGVGPEILHVPR